VRADLERFLARLLPEDDASARQADDMPAHVRSMLTGVSVCVPLAGGRLALGTHQGVFLWEHRQVLRRRCVTVTVVGH
jgi:secondary thiamine-phosphate synthase enzyme